MIDNIFGDSFKSVLSLNDFDFLSKSVFQLRLLRVVEILVLDNLGKVIVEVLILNQHLRNAFLVEQRNGCSIDHRLLEVVL